MDTDWILYLVLFDPKNEAEQNVEYRLKKQHLLTPVFEGQSKLEWKDNLMNELTHCNTNAIY
jgi:hypothetical protein